MMLTERIWSGNSLRNFHYLIACSETGEALAVDPLDHAKCLARAKEKGCMKINRQGCASPLRDASDESGVACSLAPPRAVL